METPTPEEIEEKLRELRSKLITSLTNQVDAVLRLLTTDKGGHDLKAMKKIDDDIPNFTLNIPNDDICSEMDGCVDDVMKVFCAKSGIDANQL